jgi:anti-sigma factor RsiW
MNQDQQFKLQAFLDGELPEREAREILAWTQREPAAAALLAELKNTRQAMAKAGSPQRLPESREFFWSKIEREIRQPESRAITPPRTSFMAGLRRWLLPASAVATLVIAGMLALYHAPVGTVRPVTDADAPPVVTTLANSDATTYRDAGEDTTLVWFSMVDVNPTQKKPATAIN